MGLPPALQDPSIWIPQQNIPMDENGRIILYCPNCNTEWHYIIPTLISRLQDIQAQHEQAKE
jgi:hypothetical protein